MWEKSRNSQREASKDSNFFKYISKNQQQLLKQATPKRCARVELLHKGVDLLNLFILFLLLLKLHNLTKNMRKISSLKCGDFFSNNESICMYKHLVNLVLIVCFFYMLFLKASYDDLENETENKLKQSFLVMVYKTINYGFDTFLEKVGFLVFFSWRKK